jgi:hypothetical protein
VKNAHGDSSSLRKKLRLELLRQQAQSRPCNTVSDEIEHYLTRRVPPEFEDNTRSFWENYQKTFPVLAKVAKVYLAMSIEFFVGTRRMQVLHNRINI